MAIIWGDPILSIFFNIRTFQTVRFNVPDWFRTRSDVVSIDDRVFHSIGNLNELDPWTAQQAIDAQQETDNDEDLEEDSEEEDSTSNVEEQITAQTLEFSCAEDGFKSRAQLLR